VASTWPWCVAIVPFFTTVPFSQLPLIQLPLPPAETVHSITMVRDGERGVSLPGIPLTRVKPSVKMDAMTKVSFIVILEIWDGGVVGSRGEYCRVLLVE
jgi:hypothetical protein